MTPEQIKLLEKAAKAMGYTIAGYMKYGTPYFDGVCDLMIPWTPHLGGADAMEILCKLELSVIQDYEMTDGVRKDYIAAGIAHEDIVPMVYEYLADHPSKEQAIGWALVKAAANTRED